MGIDGSECGRHAALWAVAHASGRASELRLATSWSLPVASTMTPMSPLTTAASFDGLEESAFATVDELAAQIEPSFDGVVTRCVGRGSAASLLLDSARDSDLLVVGSRGRGGFARLLLGSTSAQCATHSPGPVAVIPATAGIGPITSILVAFDGSDHSIAALSWAIGFASCGTVIECASVWDTSPIAVGSDRFFFPEATDLARQRSEHLVAATVDANDRDDVDVRAVFVEGHPRTVLAERAADSDLVVMGARGHGAIGAAVLGSVSTWLLHHVDGAMVVVRSSTADVAESDLVER
ncbi:MAG: universal stress protein [Ilumatobacter sp.]|uniref:universal stress protein n=1 Tax=Ilumatobacter sp. TaxID=1967498 RepID=UPI0032996D4F